MSRYASHCSTCLLELGDNDRCSSHPASGVYMRAIDHAWNCFCERCTPGVGDQVVEGPARILAVDDPSTDGTDAAHPAWWRGMDSGARQTAASLRIIVERGKVGTFASPEVEETANAIQALKIKLIEEERRRMVAEDEAYRLKRIVSEHAKEWGLP